MKKILSILCAVALVMTASACSEQALELNSSLTSDSEKTDAVPAESRTTVETSDTSAPETTPEKSDGESNPTTEPPAVVFPEENDPSLLSTVKLLITETYNDYFVGGLSCFPDITYKVIYPDAALYLSVGDYAVVNFLQRTPSADFTYELTPDSVAVANESEYIYGFLVITELGDGFFKAEEPFPYPAVYTVYYTDETDMSDLAVSDYVDVRYTEITYVSEFESNIRAHQVYRSENEYQIGEECVAKPVIYLYPQQETKVDVRLSFNGELTVIYPLYNNKNGWSVTAEPDGTLWLNGNEYSYLFWEGQNSAEYDFSSGFCVKGGDTAEFLREKLSLLGLTPREYNEFIVYWLPLMQNNEYNVISFQTDCYTDNAVLEVTPQPDTVLRVFMTYYGSDKAVEIPEQSLSTTERVGFTLVEWGGCRLN